MLKLSETVLSKSKRGRGEYNYLACDAECRHPVRTWSQLTGRGSETQMGHRDVLTGD